MRKMVYGPDEKVEIEIGETVFVCRAPIGAVETEIADMHARTITEKTDDDAAKQRMGREYRDAFIDIVVVGWRGDGLPEFGAHPSAAMIPGIKMRLMQEYQALMGIGDEDVKNS